MKRHTTAHLPGTSHHTLGGSDTDGIKKKDEKRREVEK
jgi:hypothetical protein